MFLFQYQLVFSNAEASKEIPIELVRGWQNNINVLVGNARDSKERGIFYNRQGITIDLTKPLSNQELEKNLIYLVSNNLKFHEFLSSVVETQKEFETRPLSENQIISGISRYLAGHMENLNTQEPAETSKCLFAGLCLSLLSLKNPSMAVEFRNTKDDEKRMNIFESEFGKGSYKKIKEVAFEFAVAYAITVQPSMLSELKAGYPAVFANIQYYVEYLRVQEEHRTRAEADRIAAELMKKQRFK